MTGQSAARYRALACALLVCTTGAGCHIAERTPVTCIPPDFPRELDKVSLPDYTIEPPDVLIVEAIRMVPKGPYRIESMDTLAIQPAAPVPGEATNLVLIVDPDGTIDL